jgi:hypothetical protein
MKRERQRPPIRVAATYRAGAQPVPEHFHVGSVIYDVAEVVDRWYDGGNVAGRPILHYFKVRTRGDSIFLLAFEPQSDRWFLVKAFGPEVPV